jgi:methyl-accepting chemotaxis protein
MENNNNHQKELLEIVERSLDDFRKGMEYREQLSIRIGRRTTQIIRFGMTGMAILGLALFYLIFILTKDFSDIRKHMTEMSGYMYSMEHDLSTVAGSITQVHETMLVLNDNIMVMPAMNSSVGNMDTNLGTLSSDLHSMVEQIHYMNGNVSSLAANMQLLNNQFTDMNRSVGHMSGNVNQMAKPMKIFPFQ